MNDTSRGVLEAETPVNPYSLLEAVNRSSDSANAAWLIYIGVIRYVGFFLHGMSWLTLVLMPVLLLTYVQLVFLPFHDTTITWMHRLTVLADILVLMLVGVFLVRLETSFLRAFWRTSRHHPLSL